jgi:UDP-N-acetylglucosamine transferase subunit ALG13
MIFVSLGTQDKPFLRVLQELENLIKTFNIKDEIIVQQGNTTYESNLFKSFKYVNNTQFVEYIQRSNIIITHAGSGSLFNAIKSGKKIIAVARLKKYGEMIDNNQTELAKKLAEEGYIIDGTYSLVEAWKMLDTFSPRPCDFTNMIVPNLKKYIDTLLR